MTTDAPVPMDELIERQKLRGLYDLRVRAREFVEKAEELTDLQESTVRHANARASGRKQAVEELAKMGLDEHGIPIKKLGAILVLAFAVSMVVGFSPATEVRPMAIAKSDAEIALVTQADNQDAGKDYVGMLITADELTKSGLVAPGAYYEGLALYNSGQNEAAANSFIRAVRLGHPYAKAALAKVRR